MKSLVIFALFCYCHAQFLVPNTLPYPWAQQYRTQDAFGGAGFAYFGLDQNRQEIRLADNRVVGQFNYIDANGNPVVNVYEAGPQGYRVRSNVLPVAPVADLTAPVHTLKAPDYTREVAEARAAFQAAFDEAAAKGKTPVTPEEPVSQVRRRRSTEEHKVPLPYYRPVVTTVDHKFETKNIESVDAATPAATTKLEVVTKEHKFQVPAIKYEQAFANIKPVTYTGVAPPFQPLVYTTTATGTPTAAAAPFQPLVYTADPSGKPINLPTMSPFVRPMVYTQGTEDSKLVTYATANSAYYPFFNPFIIPTAAEKA